MKLYRLLPFLLLAFGTAAHAASWSAWTAISASGVNVPGTTDVTAVVTSPTAGTFPVTITVADKAGDQLWTPVVYNTTFTAGQTVQEPKFTIAVPKTAVSGTYTVTVSAPGTGYTQDVDTIIVQGGTGTSSTTPPPVIIPPPVVTPPPVTTPPVTTNLAPFTCIPAPVYNAKTYLPDSNVLMDLIPASVGSANYTHWGVWDCNMPTGHFEMGVLFAMRLDAATASMVYLAGKYALGVAAASDVMAFYNSTMQANGPYTANEQAFIASKIAAYHATAFVINAGSLTASVYTLNADGTRNPVAVTGESVAIGTWCNPKDRIPTDQGYFGISGQPNAKGGSLPAKSYATCDGTVPGGTN